MTKFNEYIHQIVNLTSNESALIENAFISTRMMKGELWIKQGKICNQIAYVLSGKLRSYYIDDDGNEVTCFFLKPSTFISSFASFLKNTPANENISVLEFSELRVITERDLEKILDREDINRRAEMEKVNKEIERCESRKLNLQTKFMDEEINSSDFHEMKTKVKKDLTILKERLSFLRQKGTPYKNYVTKEIPMLENLVVFYKKADGKTKKKILGCIFSEKLIFEKGKSCNHPFSKPVSILLLIIKELQGSKKIMEVENDLQSIMAPLTDERCSYNAMIECVTIRK